MPSARCRLRGQPQPLRLHQPQTQVRHAPAALGQHRPLEDLPKAAISDDRRPQRIAEPVHAAVLAVVRPYSRMYPVPCLLEKVCRLSFRTRTRRPADVRTPQVRRHDSQWIPRRRRQRQRATFEVLHLPPADLKLLCNRPTEPVFASVLQPPGQNRPAHVMTRLAQVDGRNRNLGSRRISSNHPRPSAHGSANRQRKARQKGSAGTTVAGAWPVP